MASTLILHIGLHRTGSTSLQGFLADNAKQLLAHNILYPRFGVHNHHCELILPWQEQESGHTPCLSMQECWKPVRKILDAKDRTVIISCENLHLHLRHREKAEELKEIIGPHTIQIVIYLRRQDLHLESWYAYTVQNLREAQPILESYAYKNGQQTQDFDGLLATLESVYGKSALSVGIFESQQFHEKSLYKDFFRTAGLQWSETFTEPPKPLNSGIDYRLFPLCRAATKHITSPSEIAAFIATMRRMSSTMEHSRQYLLTHEERMTHLARFSDGNRRIAQRFFDRDTLFEAPVPNSDHNVIPHELSHDDAMEHALHIHTYWHRSIMRQFRLRDWNALMIARLTAMSDRSALDMCRLALHKMVQKIGIVLLGWNADDFLV